MSPEIDEKLFADKDELASKFSLDVVALFSFQHSSLGISGNPNNASFLYNGTNGHYPSTDQGLNALVPGLMGEVPKDAWGSPYVYRCPGRVNPNSYDLFSAGPDRIADTVDDEWGTRLLNLEAKR